MVSGSCECGGVAFTLTGALRPILVCHCSQCRKTSGHIWAATQVKDEQISFQSKQTLAWFSSSDFAKRGFCNRCGASLFWKLRDTSHTSIGAGILDAPTGLALRGHIFIRDKGDYYSLDDDLPKFGKETGRGGF